jgi:HTH-type transcriptional regulator/antitoxin HigA
LAYAHHRLEKAALVLGTSSACGNTYEKAQHPIKAPDPIDFLHYVMETRGLTRKNLEPYIGPRGRVSDILNRVRPLTLDMIHRLSQEMQLPAEVLIQDYPLRREAA